MSQAFIRPIQSMTGSSSETLTLATLQIQLELKSVNSRFLDLSFKLADDVRQAEQGLRDRLNSIFLRGKIECKISLKSSVGTGKRASPQEIDEQAIIELTSLQDTVLKHFPKAPTLSVGEILRWPGVLPETALEDDFEAATLATMGKAIDKLIAARVSEGQGLVQFILQRLEGIEALVAGVKIKMPDLLLAYEQKLVERMEIGLGKVETLNQAIPKEETLARVRQEVSLYGIKIDIAEEIGRLEGHLKECRSILRKPGPCGKRLDFMVQELNREANTLGSKSVAIGMSQTSVDLKVLIEQIREQIQNLE